MRNNLYIITIILSVLSLFIPYKTGVSYNYTSVNTNELPTINYNHLTYKINKLDSLTNIINNNLLFIENNINFDYDTIEFKKHFYVTKKFKNGKTLYFKTINK